MKSYYVYILTNKHNSVLYVGVTSNLYQRIRNHKSGLGGNFTSKYNVNRLVYYEEHSSIYQAITREKQIKKWNRLWKERLISEQNNDWEDLFACD